ncbi:hypothetical protein BBJ28_00012783 [Nothophytophthora sp. Chile5]|nr:hypothetical protein BBJ28_00012783 [Nothophytophthora sp. Chile5]
MAVGTSHFPELSDPNAAPGVRNPASRTPLINARKVTAHNFAQNLRWTKQSLPEESTAVASSFYSSATGGGASSASRAVSAASHRSIPLGVVTPYITAEIPGVPIVYRNQKVREEPRAPLAGLSLLPSALLSSQTKASNPERLNLDRRNLPVIPLLEGEQTLRLLNLQNNAIRRIENLLGLPNLIFLDLYNNRVEVFAAILACNDNEIDKMQNLNELRELRVLNLGGNLISTLENIENLTLLTELNLRRNQIHRIGAIGKLPSLLRLFLSNNKLETLEALGPLFQVESINELRLDSNGVCGSNPVEYRVRMLRGFPSLKHLDLKPLSDTDRKEALLHRTLSTRGSGLVGFREGAGLEDTMRLHAVACVKALWERRTELVHAGTSSKEARDLPSLTSWGAAKKTTGTSHVGYEEREVPPTSREDLTAYSNNAGFSEIEVHGDYRVLVIYGDALEALETSKAHAVVNAISFRYVNMDKVMAAATGAADSNLTHFGRLRRLMFSNNDLQSFEQLLWLGGLGTKAEEVRMYTLVYPLRFSQSRNTLRLNGEEITAADRLLGKQLLPKPTAPRSKMLEFAAMDALLPSKAREKDSRELKPSWSLAVLNSNTIAASAVSGIIHTASNIEKKATVHCMNAWLGLLCDWGFV